MKIMIYCVESTERKVLGEIVTRKEGRSEGRKDKKERKTCVRKFPIACASLGAPVHNTYHCGLRVRASPTSSAAIKLLLYFQHKRARLDRVSTCDVGQYLYVVGLLCWVARRDCGRDSGCLFLFLFFGARVTYD